MLTLLVVPPPSEAQQPTKRRRIALLDTTSMPARKHLWDAFRDGLRQLGYVEGDNLGADRAHAVLRELSPRCARVDASSEVTPPSPRSGE